MTTFARTLIVLTTLLAIVSPVLAEPTINEKIVAYCKEHMNQQVGDGECSSLADGALKHAGAKVWAFKDSPNEGDYVWGKLVYTLEMKDGALKKTTTPKMGIRPGDVIQLRDVKFEGKNLRGLQNYNYFYGHHTAVVLAVNKGNVLTIAEQNVNGKKLVIEAPYRLTDLKAGWIRIYRPVAN